MKLSYLLVFTKIAIIINFDLHSIIMKKLRSKQGAFITESERVFGRFGNSFEPFSQNGKVN